MSKQNMETYVAPDTCEVSSEPLLLIAELHGALALCLHDEVRGMGGLLHLRFSGDSGRPNDVTDKTLNSLLVVLDRFKRAVIGNAPRREDIQARIIAQAPPPAGASEPRATLIDLIRADLVDGKIECGTQFMRRDKPVRVCFRPSEGRVWIAGPSDIRALARAQRAVG